MLRSVNLFENAQRTLVERFGLGVTTLPVDQRRKGGDVGGHMGVRTQEALADLY